MNEYNRFKTVIFNSLNIVIVSGILPQTSTSRSKRQFLVIQKESSPTNIDIALCQSAGLTTICFDLPLVMPNCRSNLGASVLYVRVQKAKHTIINIPTHNQSAERVHPHKRRVWIPSKSNRKIWTKASRRTHRLRDCVNFHMPETFPTPSFSAPVEYDRREIPHYTQHSRISPWCVLSNILLNFLFFLLQWKLIKRHKF